MTDYVTVFERSQGFAVDSRTCVWAMAPVAVWLAAWASRVWSNSWIRWAAQAGLLVPVLMLGGPVWHWMLTPQQPPLVLEGPVTNYEFVQTRKRLEECFEVQTQRFCYWDFQWTPGFRHAAVNGGPIRPGIQVRLHSVRTTILKLEIAKEDLPSEETLAAARAETRRKLRQAKAAHPEAQAVHTAFLAVVLGLLVWFNLRWRIGMQFWTKPPNRPLTQVICRLLFAINLVSAAAGLWKDLEENPITGDNLATTVVALTTMSSVVGGLFYFMLRDMRKQGLLLDEQRAKAL